MADACDLQMDSIVLTGFIGVGKSEVGRKLAREPAYGQAGRRVDTGGRVGGPAAEAVLEAVGARRFG